MADGLLPIGAFSRASFLSVKSLRAYHEAGILVPARVDPSTGYRTYHASQLIDAAVIARLRSLDLPLEQVREVVQARDPEVTARVLAEHESTMRQRLADVERIVAELHDGLAQPAAHTPVHVRDEPHAHTLALRGRVNEENFAQFLDAAYGRLGTLRRSVSASHRSAHPARCTRRRSATTATTTSRRTSRIARPVALPSSADGVVNSEVPAARVAVLVHAGGYDTIADTYRSLGAWVAEHADPLPIPVREVYVVSYGETDDTRGSAPRSTGPSTTGATSHEPHA